MVGNKAPLILGVVFGFLAIFLVNSYIESEKRELAQGLDLIEILAASDDIPSNTALTSSMIATRKIPRKYVSENAVRPSEKDDIIGQRILTLMKRGDTILWSNFIDTAIGENLSDIIKEGERAMTMNVDIISSIGGFLRPNDHVDIIGTFSDPSSGGIMTLTILQNVTILVAGENRQSPTGGSSNSNSGSVQIGTVCVLVTPEEAQMLILAQQLGSLTFVLRNSEDIDTDREFKRVVINDVLKQEVRKKIQAKRNKQFIEVITGSGL